MYINYTNSENNSKKRKHFSVFLTKTLTEIINFNIKSPEISSEELMTHNQSAFYSKDIPEISLKEFIDRLIETLNPEISTCLIASMYIDRLCEEATMYLTWNNVYR